MSLWAMSLSGAVMIIAIVILRALLINQLPKKTFLILWGIVMVRLVIPFTAPSAFSIYSLIPEKEQSMNTQFSGIQDNLSENLPVNAMADTVNVDKTTQISIKWLVWLAGLCLCAGYFLIVYRKLYREFQTSVYKGYKQDKIEMRGDRAEMSDFPLYLNTVAGGLDRRDQTIGGFSFVVKIYAVPVVEIIG